MRGNHTAEWWLPPDTYILRTVDGRMLKVGGQGVGMATVTKVHISSPSEPRAGQISTSYCPQVDALLMLEALRRRKDWAAHKILQYFKRVRACRIRFQSESLRAAGMEASAAGQLAALDITQEPGPSAPIDLSVRGVQLLPGTDGVGDGDVRRAQAASADPMPAARLALAPMSTTEGQGPTQAHEGHSASPAGSSSGSSDELQQPPLAHPKGHRRRRRRRRQKKPLRGENEKAGRRRGPHRPKQSVGDTVSNPDEKREVLYRSLEEQLESLFEEYRQDSDAGRSGSLSALESGARDTATALVQSMWHTRMTSQEYQRVIESVLKIQGFLRMALEYRRRHKRPGRKASQSPPRPRGSGEARGSKPPRKTRPGKAQPDAHPHDGTVKDQHRHPSSEHRQSLEGRRASEKEWAARTIQKHARGRQARLQLHQAKHKRGRAIRLIQKFVRRSIVQKKAARLLRPFVAIGRLLDLKGFVLLNAATSMEWYISVTHTDLSGNFKDLKSSRVAQSNCNRVLGEGFHFADMKLTDKLEISLLVRFMGQRASAASPWMTLCSREVLLNGFRVGGESLIVNLRGRGGRFTVPLLPSSGLEQWLDDAFDRHYISSAYGELDDAWMERVRGEVLEAKLEVLLEMAPIEFHSSLTLSLLSKHTHLLDGPVLQPISLIPAEASTSPITALASSERAVFVVKEDRSLSQWRQSGHAWHIVRRTLLPSPCSVLQLAVDKVCAGLVDGNVVVFSSADNGESYWPRQALVLGSDAFVPVQIKDHGTRCGPSVSTLAGSSA
jgi:hypothetical protein